ncbi:MAG: ATP-binding protein [Actinobacteria bacterium]|nr:ATP-binding protein [Actinomycetota bacterium]MCG2789909.1 ATP-binding protein [Actinomycetes bacterium]
MLNNNADLTRFLSDLDIKDKLNIEEDLGNGYVKLKISEAERRQALQDIHTVEDIIIELLRNSRDAGSKNIFIGTKKIGNNRRVIYCIDDGDGIPPKFHNLIFQARVTSKLDDGIKDSYGFHGRGMALFSMKLTADEVRITFSDHLKGTSIYIDVNLEIIPEKKDQALLPQLIDNDGKPCLSGGVNNVIKVIMEFALQNNDINFYYGTPSQIIATMRQLSFKKNNQKDSPKFNHWDEFYNFIMENKTVITNFPSLTDNYNILDEITKKIFNMDISQRNLQRIIYNEINALEPINLNLINDKFLNNDNEDSIAVEKKSKKKLQLYDELKLANRFKDEEIRCIIKTLEEIVIKYGSKHLVTLDNNIEFKKANNTINLTINLKQKN